VEPLHDRPRVPFPADLLGHCELDSESARRYTGTVVGSTSHAELLTTPGLEAHELSFHGPAREENSDPFRAVGLVSAESHQVSTTARRPKVHFAQRLRSVNQDRNVVCATQGCDFINRIQDAGFIVGMHGSH